MTDDLDNDFGMECPKCGASDEQLFTAIAKKHLSIETLATRRSDSLDFHDVAVWCVRDALEAAYKAGFEAGKKVRRS